MKKWMHLRLSSGLLFAGLVIGSVLALKLPATWGWENGLLENFQAVTVLLGLSVACLAAWQQRSIVASKIWCVAAVVWLAMLGHELAWGAVFVPAQSVSDSHGPLYSARALWWQPAVVWVCSALLLLCGAWVVRFQLVQRAVLRWLREAAMPWGCLTVLVLAMLLSATAAGQGLWTLPQALDGQRMVLQAMAECWAYLALCWGQWLLVQHMQQWRASRYVQTLHFSISSLDEGFERRPL